jgi:hypothetical protein
MTANRQPTPDWMNPNFLRIMAETIQFQRVASMRQLETFRTYPVLIIDPQMPTTRVYSEPERVVVRP